jgi:hypothetical protein
VTLYTSTVVRPRRASRAWAKLGENTLYAIGLPIVLVVIWGIWATIAPAKFFPSPTELVEAFIDTWIGPAFVADVLPSLARLGIGIIVSIPSCASCSSRPSSSSGPCRRPCCCRSRWPSSAPPTS